MIRLIEASEFRPSAYNPRKADPSRLALVELSLRKLGFLLPLYADASGEALSGHQRHLVATERLGLNRLPVVFLEARELNERKALNVSFNRATNDMANGDTPTKLTSRLADIDIDAMAVNLPDKALDDESMFPCLSAKREPIGPLLAANKGRWTQYARNMSRALRRQKIVMPIVIDEDGVVVNGIGRLEDAANRNELDILAVRVSNNEAEFARAMLNLLSMDFDIHTRYADELRHNSFRRARRARSNLGRGMVFATNGAKPANQFDINKVGDRRAWLRTHGDKVLDFGAGHLHETDLLRRVGISVTPFEPYRVVGNEIDKAESLANVSAFLDVVASGYQWTSIFLSSVLNSVPFEADRHHVAVLCAALTRPGATLYACATARGHASFKSRSGGEFLNETHGRTIAFCLDYEPGITVGDLTTAPKVQKYHTGAEFERLFNPYFQSVRVGESTKEATAICANPIAVAPERLDQAIAFEFDLPYPDGSRMGLAHKAREAFAKRREVLS